MALVCYVTESPKTNKRYRYSLGVKNINELGVGYAAKDHEIALNFIFLTLDRWVNSARVSLQDKPVLQSILRLVMVTYHT